MKQKVITGAVLVLIAIILFLLPEKIGRIVIAVLAAILATLAYKELIDLKEKNKGYPNIIKIIGFIAMMIMVFNSLNPLIIYNGVSYLSIALIFLILLIPTIFSKKGRYTTKDSLFLIGIIVFIGLFFNTFMLLFIANKWLFLYLLLVATMTDTFAMLIGCLIGKHKLIPEISPNKTIEGSVAGSLIATVIASIYYYNVIANDINLLVLIGMTLILSILGQLGDLLFSKIKRENEIKDFSNFIPGHGGILDRFDSLTFIIFGYIIIINILNMLK